MSTLDQFFGPPISTYTRAEALRDHLLIDITDEARDAGFGHPVAITATAWADAVAWDQGDDSLQDERGRLHDVLTMAAHAARRTSERNPRPFGVLRIPNRPGATAAHTALAELIIHCGPGDDAEPVITIMRPGED